MKATALIPAPIRALWKEAANFIVCVRLQVDRDKVRRHRPHTGRAPIDLAQRRRCYDEWNRLVPAPQLAARLDALNRIIADPAAIIRRTARRLLSNRERTKFLVRDAYPKIAMPRRARHVVTSGHAQELAHAAQDKLDTS